ncbi:hypothetical protein LZ30DRAFT_807316 [Colletotrichum cereale]|nr:hypothetical protein LZ30DRAFT_807316 [Colletotrichum cereale]
MATEFCAESTVKHPAYPEKARSMFNPMRYTPEDVEAAEILMGMRTRSWDMADSCPPLPRPLEIVAHGHLPSPPSSNMTNSDPHFIPSPTISASSLSSTASQDRPKPRIKIINRRVSTSTTISAASSSSSTVSPDRPKPRIKIINRRVSTSTTISAASSSSSTVSPDRPKPRIKIIERTQGITKAPSKARQPRSSPRSGKNKKGSFVVRETQSSGDQNNVGENRVTFDPNPELGISVASVARHQVPSDPLIRNFSLRSFFQPVL